MMATFQDRLISLAAASEWGWQANLSRHCGVSRAAVNHWISGRNKNARTVHVRAIAEFFQVHSQWLATGLGPELKEASARGEQRKH